MNINEKIKSELESLNYSKKEIEERLQEVKNKTIELISKADSDIINNLESYNCYTELRLYSKRLEEIKIKLRVINYLSE
jgi:hypothetical protein